MTYRVKEIFRTIQGEGFHAGTPAVFVRFAGCNVWSGHTKDRLRDSAKSACAMWCDTDFVGGEVMSAAKIVATVNGLGAGIVVFTGGEPSLQMDGLLVSTLLARGRVVHVETNGSRKLPFCNWRTLSPKPPLEVVRQQYDEVKVVYPAYDPLPWEDFAIRRYVQPQDGYPGALQACIDFVLANPGWRLSLQTHKLIGLP